MGLEVVPLEGRTRGAGDLGAAQVAGEGSLAHLRIARDVEEEDGSSVRIAREFEEQRRMSSVQIASEFEEQRRV